MATPAGQSEDKLIALASIAVELSSVMAVAWGVSLAAKNAKVISAQAGDKGLGFQPITEFIDEISQQAMKGVNDINEEAMYLTKVAVNEQRSVDAYHRFESVMKKYSDTCFIKSLSPTMQRVEQHMLASTQAMKKSLRRLYTLLEAMDECMLSARAIAAVSRIVTSDAQEYRDKLKVVADDLDKATNYIKEKLSDSYQHLSIVNRQILKRV